MNYDKKDNSFKLTKETKINYEYWRLGWIRKVIKDPF